jgi:hypothetical protein
MPKMHQLVEDMHARLNEVSASEQALLRTLRDALSQADDKLMREVRNISAEHDTRRKALLGELQSLAARLGEFPALGETAAPGLVTDVHHGAWPQGVVEEGGPRSITHSGQRRPTTADVTAELDLYFKKRAS